MEEFEQTAVASALLDLASEFDGEPLTHALDDFGWGDLLRSEPAVAVPSLFLAQGRAGSWSAALHDVLLEAAPLENCDLAGSAVLVPWPGSALTPERSHGCLGLLIGAREDRSSVIVIDGIGTRPRVLRFVDDHVGVEPVVGLDQGLPVLQVTGRIDNGDVLVEGQQAETWWIEVVASGRRAIAFELCGAMEAMLELAVAHAVERRQFGRPVGSFQAIRHRLAECRVAASGAFEAAAASLEDEETELSSITAKVVAGRAQQQVGAHCQQVLAGMGFTSGHPFHRYAIRAAVMDRMLGSAVELAPKLGRALIDRGGPFRGAEL